MTIKIRSFCLALLLALLALPLSECVVEAANAQEFYRRAKKIDKIHPFAATCQSAHETGNWTSDLWKRANNGAGIKADKNWRAAGRPSVQKQSKEMVGGKMVSRTSHFRSYKSMDEFLKDYRTKITRDYPLAAKHCDTMWGYFSSLQKGRNGAWATNKHYYERLTDKAIQLAPKLLGAKWKTKLLDEYKVAKKRGILSKNEIAVIEKKFRAAGIRTK